MRDFSDQYLSILKNELAGINLTRILEPEEFYEKQIVDSLAPIGASNIFNELMDERRFMVDIGFGGGFPILPMAKYYPDSGFVGFEARGKKAKAVSQIAELLGLDNVTLMHKRVEEVYFDLPVVITFKAVGKVADFLPLINSEEEQYVFFYKGPNYQELEGNDKLPAGWEKVEEIELEIGETKRLLLCFKGSKVPRGTKVRKKNLVSLSELI